VPILAYRHHLDSINLGKRNTFADLGQTLAEMFAVSPMAYGESFFRELSVVSK
jgi:phosphopentomutase